MAAQKSRMNRRIHQAKVQNNNESNCSTPVPSFKFKVYFHLFHTSAWERCIYFTISTHLLMRKLPPQRIAFPEFLEDVFQIFLRFERGDIWAVVSVLCRIGQDCVRINYAGPHKKRHGNIFCRSQLWRENFRRLQGPLLAGYPPPSFTRKTLGSHRDEVARPPRNFEPAIIVVIRSGLFAGCHA